MLVDCAIYKDGKRVVEPSSLDEFYEASRNGAGVAWLGLHEPSKEELASVHASSTCTRWRSRTRFTPTNDRSWSATATRSSSCFEAPGTSTRTRRSSSARSTCSRADVRDHDPPRPASELGRVRKEPRVAATAPAARPDVDRPRDRRPRRRRLRAGSTGIENDVDEIENEVFGGESREVSRRIYRLSREVIEFRRATGPLPDVLARLIDESGDDEEKRYLRDVQDHAIRVHERLDGFHELLRNILNVNLTLETKALNEAGNRQNEEVKRISAWAAILFAPTLVGTIYGMNFEHMPS